MALRLRQIALVAPQLGPAIIAISEQLGLEVCYHDPGVAEFGLENALFRIGDAFLEVVAPIREGTTAGRLLDKRDGAGGYMAIFQCDDLDRRRARLESLGVRVVWQGDFPGIRGTHLHPRDVGGAIVSIDEAEPWESWRWAGPAWEQRSPSGVADRLVGMMVGALDPSAMLARWSDVLDAPSEGNRLSTDEGTVWFAEAGPRGEGIDALLLRAAEPARRGEHLDVCGVRVVLL
jgi:hypothetical protein